MHGLKPAFPTSNAVIEQAAAGIFQTLKLNFGVKV